MNRAGASFEGGMSRRKVVEVPRERMASPEAEKDATVAGLSPVKGAIEQSMKGTKFRIRVSKIDD